MLGKTSEKRNFVVVVAAVVAAVVGWHSRDSRQQKETAKREKDQPERSQKENETRSSGRETVAAVALKERAVPRVPRSKVWTKKVPCEELWKKKKAEVEVGVEVEVEVCVASRSASVRGVVAR